MVLYKHMPTWMYYYQSPTNKYTKKSFELLEIPITMKLSGVNVIGSVKTLHDRVQF